MRSAALILFLFTALSDLHAADTIAWRENLATSTAAKAGAVEDSQPAKPVLLFITAPGCSYCIKMKSDTFADRDVVAKVRQKFTAVKVDGRKHQKVAQKLKVKLYPTTAIVHPSGAVVEVISGYIGPKDFLNRLAAAEQKLSYQTKLLAARSRPAVVK